MSVPVRLSHPHLGTGRWDDPEVDEIAVQLACDGVLTRLTYAERVEAVRRLTERGLSAATIGRRLRLAERSVVRLRGAS